MRIKLRHHGEIYKYLYTLREIFNIYAMMQVFSAQSGGLVSRQAYVMLTLTDLVRQMLF